MAFGGLFSTSSGQASPFRFKPISIDTSLIGAQLQANVLKASAPYFSTALPKELPSIRGDAVIAPWEVSPEQGSLASRMNEVRGLTKFISEDPRAEPVKLAANDKTSKSLFVMYQALDALRTIAQYASEKNTLNSGLPRLNTMFQQGMGELQESLPTA